MSELKCLGVTAVHLIVIFILTKSSAAYAAVSNDALTQVVLVGINNAFNLQSQKLVLEESNNTRLNTYSALLPTISLSAGKTLQDQQTLSNTNANGNLNGSTTFSNSATAAMSISANWTLWNGYANITNVEVGNKNYEATREGSRQQVQNYIVQVVTAFLNYQLLLAQEEISQGQVKASQRTNEESQALVKAGAKTRLDAMDAEIQLANDQIALLTTQNSITAAERSLHAQLSTPSSDHFPRLDLLTFEPYFQKDFERQLEDIRTHWSDRLAANQPDLKVSRLQLESAALGLRQTKLGYLPTTQIQLTHNITLDSYVNPESYQAEPLQSDSIMLTLNWTFWDWLQTPRNIDNAQKGYDSQTLGYRTLDMTTQANFLNSLDQVDILKKTIETYRLVLDKAQKQQEYSQEMYRLGRVSWLEMQQSTLRFATAQSNLAQSLVSYYTAAAQILYNVGYDLAPEGSKLSWIR